MNNSEEVLKVILYSLISPTYSEQNIYHDIDSVTYR